MTPFKKQKNPAAVALGSLGGKARAKKLSPEQRKEIAEKGRVEAQKAREKLPMSKRRAMARKAAKARWAKEKKGGKHGRVSRTQKTEDYPRSLSLE